MKNILIILLLLVECTAIAQDAAPTLPVEKKHNRVYFNLFDLVFSTFSVSYERDIRRNSLMITAGGILSEDKQKSKTGGMGEVHYRLNLVDEKAGYDRTALFYLSPYFQYKYIDAEEIINASTNSYPVTATYTYTTAANLRSYHVGALLGLSLYAFKGRFCTSFYAGSGLRKVDIKGNQNLFNINLFQAGYSGVIPRLGFQLGIGF